MRFRYPLYYPILFGLAFLFCASLSLFYLIDGGQTLVILCLAAAGILWLYMFYGTTNTIFIDSQGIKLNSLFGELNSLSWSQIEEIKSGSILSPGIKIFDGMGNKIEINTMFNHYDQIVELIRLNVTHLSRKSSHSASSHSSPLSGELADFSFKARSWRWIAIPILIGFGILFFRIIFQLTDFLYQLLAGILSLVVIPGGLYSFLRQPVLIESHGNQLTIHFQSELLRRPLQISAGEIRGLGFNHQRVPSAHGGENPTTEVVILLSNNTRLAIGNNFTASNEEIYWALSSWLQTYVSIEEN